MKRLIAVCAGLLAIATSAAAESPVAVVEDVQGKVTGAEFMDYVTPKAVIKIGDGGSIVLSYMTSCRREKQAHVTTRENSGVAATVLRSMDKDKAAPLPKPRLTLYGASPFVEAKGRGTLVLQRLDVAGEREQVDLGGTQLKGKFFDFASADRALAPGGLYAATFKSSKVVFQVDPQAKPGATPIVGRLLRME